MFTEFARMLAFGLNYRDRTGCQQFQSGGRWSRRLPQSMAETNVWGSMRSCEGFVNRIWVNPRRWVGDAGRTSEKEPRVGFTERHNWSRVGARKFVGIDVVEERCGMEVSMPQCRAARSIGHPSLIQFRHEHWRSALVCIVTRLVSPEWMCRLDPLVL